MSLYAPWLTFCYKHFTINIVMEIDKYSVSSGSSFQEFDRRKANVERRKEELKAKLAQVRKENAKEDFENRNMGHFQRIFPPVDKAKAELYERLLHDAFQLLLSSSGKGLTSWRKDVTGLFPSKLQVNGSCHFHAKHRTFVLVSHVMCYWSLVLNQRWGIHFEVNLDRHTQWYTN